MSSWFRALTRLRPRFGARATRDDELADELRFHFDMQIAENRRRGMSEAEARRAARIHFGGVERFKEECRDEWRGSTIEMFAQDVRFALRTLRRSPGFTVAAILTLALGIGANTAIFSLVYGVLLRPLPYSDGEQLVLLRQSAPLAGVDNVAFSIKEVYDYRDQSATLSGLVEHHGMTFTLLGRGEPERVATAVVSADFFDVLGVTPLYGRTFRDEDDDLGSEAVLVLSHPYWQRSFGADPDIVGAVFEMNDRPHTVVGVLPPIPQFPADSDVYMPTSACPFRANGEDQMHENRSAFRGMTVFARLDEQSTVAESRADLATIARRFQHDYPDTYPEERGYAVTALPLQQELTEQARPTLFILLATAVLVLLIACANVANLNVARLIRRQREMAVRSSLGADRSRLVRQMLTESTVLSLAGGALGLLLAFGGLDLLVAFTTRFTPRAVGITIDGWVLFFTFLVAVSTGLAFGAAPAFATRGNLAASLHERTDQAGGRAKQRLRSLLIVAQVAISVVLLFGAGLMVRSVYKLQQVDPGFNPENVLTAEVSLNWTKYADREDYLHFFDDLVERVRAHPGVIAAALIDNIPLSQQGVFTRGFQIEGLPVEDGGLAPQMERRVVSIDYFRTLDIPVIAGRTFRLTDEADGVRVAIINRSLAKKYWGDQDPIGRRVAPIDTEDWMTIVGIVGDVRHHGIDQRASDEIYVPVAQTGVATRVVVRTSSEPMMMAREIKDMVYAIDPDQPVSNIETLEQKRSESIASPRVTAALLGLFALLALAITATGIGGVIAFSVSQRTHEIGIRMALGARAGRVLVMVLGQGLLLVAVGLAIGLTTALLVGRSLSGVLFEVQSSDPVTLAAVAALLVAAAVAACLLPARRATLVEPTTALRTD